MNKDELAKKIISLYESMRFRDIAITIRQICPAFESITERNFGELKNDLLGCELVIWASEYLRKPLYDLGEKELKNAQPER
jgi:hypothetical protein